MSVRKYNNSPWAKAKRFLPLGYHPKMEFRPGTHKFIRVGPGLYPNYKRRKVVSNVLRWQKQAALEEFSRNVGYSGEHILKERQWLKSINGPGWQDISYSPFIPGGTFFKSERFPDDKFKSCAVPGPGTYGKNHVPHTRHEEKSLSKGFSFSILSPFEQRTQTPRSHNIQLTYHLPPNLYKVKNGTDELLSKRVSKRGPYDLFSVERFPDPVTYKQPSHAEKVHPWNWNHPKNSFKGKFSRCGRESQITTRLALVCPAWCKKNPLDPGPSHYNPYPMIPPPQMKAPFNTSVLEARPTVKFKEYQLP